MNKARASRIAVLLTLTTCVSIASAGAPMGPPIATLEGGQWSFGGEFAHETADLEASGTLTYVFPDVSWKQDFEIEDLASLQNVILIG